MHANHIEQHCVSHSRGPFSRQSGLSIVTSVQQSDYTIVRAKLGLQLSDLWGVAS